MKRTRKGEWAGAHSRQLKCERLGLKNVRILYWNCVLFHQCRPILNKVLYGADVVALQETYLCDRTVRITSFHCFYNGQHLVRDNLPAPEVDMSKWDSDDLQVHAVAVQTPASLVKMNV